MTELAGVMADNPGAVIETVAKEHGVTPRAVVEALPDSMRRFAPAESFVERPFMGRLSALIVFFNTDCGIMFKIFVGRDEARELKGDQLAAFRSLAGQLAVTPRPALALPSNATKWLRVPAACAILTCNLEVAYEQQHQKAYRAQGARLARLARVDGPPRVR
jgi:hypothetical protein